MKKECMKEEIINLTKKIDINQLKEIIKGTITEVKSNRNKSIVNCTK